MKHVSWVLIVASIGLAGCSKQESKPTPPQTNPPAASGNPLTAPVDYVGAVGRAQKSATKVTSTVGIQQAIQMYHVQEGRYPKDLNELVGGDYLPRMPEPPAGMRYDYNPTSGEVRVVPK